MKKNLTAYYGLLATTVLAQVLFTVFTLSQNIAYGQKISFLENKKTSIQVEKSKISQELAQKIAIKELEQKNDDGFIAITDVVSIARGSSNLALK